MCVVIGIDASRNRSGGAIAHMRGLLSAADPRHYGIGHVHFWAHDVLLDTVAEQPWLSKHRVSSSRKSILRQMGWQRYRLPVLARRLGVDAMFNSDAGSVCPFQPSATLSQDMLSFEPGEIRRYPWGRRARLRLELLRVIQLNRLRRSTVALFLTAHAQRVIGALGALPEVRVIAHGIDPCFFDAAERRPDWPESGSVRCLYVSNVAPYKHQWHVVEALAQLRATSGRDLQLRLVGGGTGPALARLSAAVARHDPDERFVKLLDFLPYSSIVDELAAADLFIYASSCENLPITLLEAMAARLPIASSDRGPMPDTLGDHGVYFDPEDPDTIAAAVSRILTNGVLRAQISLGAQRMAHDFTWARCAAQTWTTLAALVQKDRS